MNETEIVSELKRIMSVERDAIAYSIGLIGDSAVKAVLNLAAAEKIIVSGVGKSGDVARKIASTFTSVGSPALFVHPVDALHGDIGIAGKRDVAIIISRSGTTAELVNLLPYLKEHVSSVIAIVSTPDSLLAREADVALDARISSEACPLNLAPSASTTVALAIGDALALTVMKFKNFTKFDYAKTHPMGQLGINLRLRAKDLMRAGQELPSVKHDVSFREVLINITEKGLGCTCVCSSTGELKGIITDGDVRRTLQQHEDIRGLVAEDVMTREPLTISHDTLIGEALALMEEGARQISVLPVVGIHDECLGILRLHDIIRSGR